MPEQSLLGWGELRRLTSEGVQVGSHTRTHADLRTLSGLALADEIEADARILQSHLRHTVHTFAYPYGRYGREAVAAVRARFRFACTTRFRPLRRVEDPHLLPRLDAIYFRAAGARMSWDSPAFAAYLHLRSGLRRIRPLLRSFV